MATHPALCLIVGELVPIIDLDHFFLPHDVPGLIRHCQHTKPPQSKIRCKHTATVPGPRNRHDCYLVFIRARVLAEAANHHLLVCLDMAISCVSLFAEITKLSQWPYVLDFRAAKLIRECHTAPIRSWLSQTNHQGYRGESSSALTWSTVGRCASRFGILAEVNPSAVEYVK